MTAIPEEFTKVLKDFVRDLKTTFPEYEPFISKWWKEKEHFANIAHEDDRTQAYEKALEKSVKLLFSFCQKKFPPRFFDILYKSQDIFLIESTANTEFLPGIFFKQLWNCDISDATRDTIWSYLQLILFSVMASVNDTGSLGDTAKLFEAINEDELRRKLESTMEEMQKIFDINLNKEVEDCIDPESKK